jgi:MFS family permease
LGLGSLYAWSVFAWRLAARLGDMGVQVQASDLSFVFALANLISPAILICGGAVNDKIGPKWIIFFGGLVFGAGIAIAGAVNSVGAIAVSYGLVGGAGMGFAYGAAVSSSVKFFPDKRGLAGGLAVAAYGLGSVVIPIPANYLGDTVGITKTMLIIGIATAFVVCSCALLLEKCPEGYKPESYKPDLRQGPEIDMSWRDMLKSPRFYIMLFIMFCGGLFGLMIISQAATVAQSMAGFSAAGAAASVSALAFSNAAGRILCGFISDKIGRINCLSAALAVAIAALATLGLAPAGALLFIISLCLIGFCFGAFMGIYPSFTADVFGAKQNGANYGIMFIGFAAAGVAGPAIINSIHQSTGSYRQAFLAAAGIAVTGLVLTFSYRKLSCDLKKI